MKPSELKPIMRTCEDNGEFKFQDLYTASQMASAIESAMICADERARRIIYSDGGWGDKIAELRGNN